jgi:monofunctional biosynthetic peptidoglycan transglycosylase
VEAGAQRYWGQSASNLTTIEAGRMAAALPSPKTRSVKSPSGFTRRYGNTIAARIGTVKTQGLDSCVYD